jgi:2',3'-cyclic-nucleotide 2'-phosphodiesterase (5'-nucleotidase family)
MTKSFGILLFVLVTFFVGCAPKQLAVVEYVYAYQNVDSNYFQVDSTLYYSIKPYSLKLSQIMEEVIVYSGGTFTKAKPESTLGNLLADATKEIAEKHTNQKIDVAFINYGGIRVPELSEGKVTIGHVYELMPFDNYLVTIDLTGNELNQVLQAIAKADGWPISGASFNITNNNEAINIRVGNRPIHPNFIYTIALSDYIANGGDNMSMLVPLVQNNTGVLLRDAFIQYFTEIGKQGNALEAKLEGRINKQ